MGKLIYLDNAATTKTAPEVVDAMLPYFTEHFGNPSSVYGFAAANKEVITKQREIIAKALGAKTEEIYFTAGGSESDNWALKATAEAYESKGKHIITTKIGWILPISLFANITLTRIVSGRIAASTASGLTIPFSSTSR